MTRRRTNHDEPVEADADDVALEPRLDLRDLLRVHPRLLLAAAIVSVLMVPVGLFLAAVGVKVLDLSGGAARDTSIVVGIAGVLVSDFWGGGIVASVTRARAPQVAVAGGIVRLVALVALLAFGVVDSGLVPLVPLQLALAVAAAWAGARVARKQAALRRQIERERGAAEERAARRSGASASASAAATASPMATRADPGA